MATDISTKEPETFRAGDTVKWKKALDCYKASDGWTLKYSFRGTAGTIDITSSASGDDHLIEVSAATSAAYGAGLYAVQGYVEKDSDRQKCLSLSV